MDWTAFQQKMHDDYGIETDDLKGIRDLALVTFSVDRKSNYVRGFRGTVPVFRDRDHEDEIAPGDSWICQLSRPATASCYFAIPLVKIDASFVFALKHDEIGEIGEVIWQKYRPQIMPELEERYHQLNQEAQERAVQENEAKCQVQIRELNEKLDDLTKRDTEDQAIIASLQEKLTAQKAAVRPEPTAERPPYEARETPTAAETEDTVVHRIGPDLIRSEYFTNPRYSVNFCPDLKTLYVAANNRGSVVCIDNTIELAGLHLISYYKGEERTMRVNCSSHCNNLQIMLD